MFGIPIWAGWLIGAVILAGSSFYGGIKVEADYRDSQQLKIAQQQLATFQAESLKLNLVSQDLETKLESLNAFYAPIFVQVEKVVAAAPDVYARPCFDPAGLSIANAALAAPTDPGQPHPALSSAVSAARRDGGNSTP